MEMSATTVPLLSASVVVNVSEDKEFKSSETRQQCAPYNPEGWPGCASDAEMRRSNVGSRGNLNTPRDNSGIETKKDDAAAMANDPERRIQRRDTIMLDSCQDIQSQLEKGMDPSKLKAKIAELTSGFKAKVAELSNMKASQKEQSMSDIKVRTMYQMVEQVDTGTGDPTNLLFLTNKQARLLSKQDSNIDKILAAFEIPEPKLIINLLMDYAGGCPSLNPANSGWGLAFPTKKEADDAFFRLVAFMARVVIPLAVKTNALILCSASNTSIISRALLEAFQTVESTTKEHLTVLGFATQISSWMKGKQGKTDSCFRKVSKQSANWRPQQRLIDEECRWKRSAKFAWKDVAPHQDFESGGHGDLLPLQNLIIIDTYDVKTKTIDDKRAFTEFFNSFCETLFSRFGSVTFKTGRTNFGGQSDIIHCINALGANGPVFLLDSVKRPVRPNNKCSRDQLLRDVKAKHKPIPRIMWVTEERFEEIWGDRAEEKKRECNEETLRRLAHLGADVSNPDGHRFFRIATESLVIDMIAYADMLFESNWEKEQEAGKEIVHLYTEIANISNDNVQSESDRSSAQTTKEIEDFLFWYMDSYDDFYNRRWHGQIADPEFVARLKKRTVMQGTAIVQNPKVFGIQTSEIARAQELLETVTQLDRLPRKESLAGLLLLRECWDEHDITMHLANRYKLASNGLYYLLLVLGVIIMVMVAVSTRANAYYDLARAVDAVPTPAPPNASHSGGLPKDVPSDESELDMLDVDFWPEVWPPGLGPVFRVIIFVLTLASTFVMGLTAYVNPAARWRHLRAFATELASIIWKYRTRTGEFSLSTESNAMAPPEKKKDGGAFASGASSSEKSLKIALTKWRTRVVNAADLSSTLLQRRPAPSSDVYKHGQYQPAKPAPQLRHSANGAGLPDDHYSPATPQLYYEHRLLRHIEFYETKLVPATRCRNLMNIVMLILAVLSGVFAFFDQGLYVAVLTGITAAIASTSEYTNVTMKITRYNKTIEGIKNLQSYWNSIDEMEQSALKSVNHLVNAGEALIGREIKTWFSTFQKKKKKNKKEE